MLNVITRRLIIAPSQTVLAQRTMASDNVHKVLHDKTKHMFYIPLEKGI